MTGDPDFQKLRFEVEKDEDGWPPVASEGLWAVALGAGLYRLDNIPWFASNIAADDVFRAVADDEDVLWAPREGAGVGKLHHPRGPVS